MSYKDELLKFLSNSGSNMAEIHPITDDKGYSNKEIKETISDLKKDKIIDTDDKYRQIGGGDPKNLMTSRSLRITARLTTPLGEKYVSDNYSKTKNEKYLIFLDYALDKLKNGRPAGISLRNLVSDYKTETRRTLDNSEQKEFMQLYNGLYFDKAENSIDRLKIKDETTKILLKYGSIREYLKQQENQSSSSKSNAPTQPAITATAKITGFIFKNITKIIIGVIIGVLVLILWSLYGTDITNYFSK